MVTKLPLFEIYQNWKQATVNWYFMCKRLYGILPTEMYVDKITLHLITCYYYGRGNVACGNWLDLRLAIDYLPILNDTGALILKSSESDMGITIVPHRYLIREISEEDLICLKKE